MRRKFQHAVRYLGEHWWAILLVLIVVTWFLFAKFDSNDLSANLFSELVGIVVTVVVLESLFRVREQKRLVEDLVLQIHSPFTGFSLEAVRILDAKGLLKKGILRKRLIDRANLTGVSMVNADLNQVKINLCNFSSANLNGASLENARIYDSVFTGAVFHRTSFKNAGIFLTVRNNFDFKNCSFIQANFSGLTMYSNVEGKILSDPQFQFAAAWNMRGAIMPDGTLYDGRFNLEQDMQQAAVDKVNINSTMEMARFYGVSVTQYTHGQEWFRKKKRS